MLDPVERAEWFHRFYQQTVARLPRDVCPMRARNRAWSMSAIAEQFLPNDEEPFVETEAEG